ncbi:MAG: molybdopterin-dependent oxidoreductase [Candidatus Thorarchaeota archaeon]|nr:molybdopterin-dependent oxidoreductase [Candidatus Thorarchaeota archaeon]
MAYAYRVVCPRDCYDNCVLNVLVDTDGTISSVRGDPSHIATQGLTCPRALKDMERVNTNRVLFPHICRGSKPCESFERVSWQYALDTVADRLSTTLQQDGPESVLLIDYAGNTGLLSFVYSHRLWNALGVTRTDYSLCSISGHAALSLHYGKSYGVQPEDLLKMRLIIYWGFNGAVSSPHMWKLSKMARDRNDAPIVVVDPRKSRSAEQADIWIQPRPGTDVALAYGVARYLIVNELIDGAFIKEWTVGFDAFREEAMTWEPKRVTAISGVKEADIETLATMYSQLKPSATMIGVGFQKSIQGAESVRAVSLLPALVGLHRGFFYSNTSAFSVNMSYLSGASFSERRPKKISQVALAESVERGDFRFVFIYNMNPVMSIPGQEALRKGLARDDVYVVVHETHWTETTSFADMVLPASTYFEKDDVVIPWAHRDVMISRGVIPPQGESKSEVWLMHELARRLGRHEPWLYEPPLDALKVTIETALETGTFADLLNGAMLRLRCRTLSEYQTPSGKIELSITKAEERGLTPVPQQITLAVPDDRFILLSSSLPKYSHTQFQEVYGTIPSVIYLNPRDAQRFHIQNGDRVSVSNSGGKIHLKSIVSDTVPEGVLWTPSLGAGLNAVPLNALTSAATQSLGGGSTFNSTIVSLAKA